MKKLNLFLLIYKLNCTIKQIACKKTITFPAKFKISM